MTRLAFILLFAILSFRAFSLELQDLSDPTESRYGSIAQQMLSTGDWLTPQLPSVEGGYAPYLGKPPFHFWAIASSYKLFGVEEWTTRFPSFLAGLITLGLIAFLSLKMFDTKVAIFSALIVATSGLFFIFSGSSMVDVTLTMAVTLSLVSYLFYWETSGVKSNLAAFLCAVGAAISFLTKGPIGLVLIAAPIISAALIRKDFKKFLHFPWLVGVGAFCALVLPWFALAEHANPGFLKYFFWNENIARYLLKDYGDRYGSGHKYPYGMALVFLALGFLPWTPFAVRQAYLWLKNNSLLTLRNWSNLDLVLLAWALFPALFFSFGRQLHSGYILPCLPALGLLLARSFVSRERTLVLPSWSKMSLLIIWMLCFVALLVGLVLGRDEVFGVFSMCIGFGGFVASFLVSRALGPKDISSKFCLEYSLAAATALCAAFVALSPVVSKSHSSEVALKAIAHESTDLIPVVGILTQNTFSHYWVASAWQGELEKQVIVRYFDQDKDAPRNLLVEQKEIAKIPEKIRNAFRVRKHIGQWTWLEAVS